MATPPAFAPGAKEVLRAGRVQRVSTEQRSQAVHPGPVVHLLNESIFHRVGRHVHQLVHHVGRLDEMDHADLLAGPEVLPPPAHASVVRVSSP
jgi:hypothetical protein